MASDLDFSDKPEKQAKFEALNVAKVRTPQTPMSPFALPCLLSPVRALRGLCDSCEEM